MPLAPRPIALALMREKGEEDEDEEESEAEGDEDRDAAPHGPRRGVRERGPGIPGRQQKQVSDAKHGRRGEGGGGERTRRTRMRRTARRRAMGTSMRRRMGCAAWARRTDPKLLSDVGEMVSSHSARETMARDKGESGTKEKKEWSEGGGGASRSSPACARMPKSDIETQSSGGLFPPLAVGRFGVRVRVQKAPL
jgi:hypothetical protein